MRSSGSGGRRARAGSRRQRSAKLQRASLPELPDATSFTWHKERASKTSTYKQTYIHTYIHIYTDLHINSRNLTRQLFLAIAKTTSQLVIFTV